MAKKEHEKIITTPHPLSKQFFIITVIVVLGALSGAGYYGYKIRQLNAKNLASQEEKIKVTEEALNKMLAEKVTTEEIKKDVTEINIDEIKSAVAELKAAMSAFTR